jgi:hypothetical protein
MLFAPLRLGSYYDGIELSLVDGGVHDNQKTVALLASDCNVVLVSDACGHLMLEGAQLRPEGPRAFDHPVRGSLMERVRRFCGPGRSAAVRPAARLDVFST